MGINITTLHHFIKSISSYKVQCIRIFDVKYIEYLEIVAHKIKQAFSIPSPKVLMTDEAIVYLKDEFNYYI